MRVPPASAFVDESVPQGMTYTYYVVAVHFRPHRTASAHVSVTPEAPAAPPADALLAQQPAEQPAEELLPVDAEPATHHSPRSAAPRRLKVARVTRHSVTLSWPAVHGARYLVFRRMPKRPWSREPVGATERGRFTDRRLKAHTRYEYRLVAVSSAGARSEAWPAVRVRTRSRKR